MKEILIFAGTTEGRKLSECLVRAGICHTICVATEYGEIVLAEHPLAKIHCGRMNQEEIRQFIQKGNYGAVVDATHPYAELITENIRSAMRDMSIPYMRLKRETDAESDYEKIVLLDSNETCAEALAAIEGNILLTTGSKELSVYCSSQKLKDRLYVRVLPGMESLKLCMEQGIAGKQILALQGPFSTEMNEAMLRQYQIKCMVTKKSGRNGGYQEKLEAAKRLGIPVFVIGQAQNQEGDSFDDVCRKLETLWGQRISQKKKMEIVLAGVGMGSKDSLTGEVCQIIEEADILLGAERMIEKHHPRLEKKPFYSADQIIPYLRNLRKVQIKVAVLFSGDSGFYSGCPGLYQALQEEVKSGRLEASIRIMPGISSVSGLSACIGESYQDAAIYSMHGKECPNLAGKIRKEKKTFLLLSGVKDINRLGRLLMDAGLQHCEVIAGYQLSYPEQQIMTLTPKECLTLRNEGLYTCCIKNAEAEQKTLTHGRGDTEFIRDKVPMTREEIREVSICKLKLHKEAVVYDIGSGTGSIAIEIAGLSDSIQVFAIEKKEEAVSLMKKNQEKFRLENVEIVKADAPEGLMELPVPTHAFLGGSSGRMKEILSLLYRKNPGMRVVINAISMETICEIKEILSLYPLEQEEIVQLQVSRMRNAGRYHLMQAENPVWIFAFCFREVTSDEA